MDHASLNNDRAEKLSALAFMLSSGRQAGQDEPLVYDETSLGDFFTKRHLSSPDSPPPSISSSSLSLHSRGTSLSNMLSPAKFTLQNLAAVNMASPFYSTPDTIASTPKTILKNAIASLTELMDSRLKSTVLQLMEKTAAAGNNQLSRVLLKLLSPSRNPIHAATVVTRFVAPEENDQLKKSIHETGDLVSVPVLFKMAADIKIFGETSTVEICTNVKLSGKFCPEDGLLSSVDFKFDCSQLLRCMIAHARILIKTTLTRAAALSIQISELNLTPPESENLQAASSILSLQSLGSAASFSSLSGMSFSSFFTSCSSLSSKKSLTRPKKEQSNANATFDEAIDLPRAHHSNPCSVVRFCENLSVLKTPSPPLAPSPLQQQLQKQPSNIHKGLFSWLEGDGMILSEEKIKEQDKLNEERERKRREAPMPLRFFTAEKSLDAVSEAIFGDASQHMDGQRYKRRKTNC